MTDTADLQFERAQFDDGPAQPACALRDDPLFGAYFELNGEAVCDPAAPRRVSRGWRRDSR